jgi:hypothetical protein
MLIFRLRIIRYAVFYWTASNISYDVDKMVALNNKEALENNSTKILKSKKGVCSDYTKIFKEKQIKWVLIRRP